MKTASELLNRITKAKRSQVPLLAYIHEQDSLLGCKVGWCGSWLYFREWAASAQTRLLNANFCKKHTLCQACAVRRAGKLVEAYSPKVEAVMKERPELIPVMITLTIKNGPNLAERLEHLKASKSELFEQARKGRSTSGRHASIEWCKVAGSLCATEVTMSKDGQWHPHCHVFALLTDYVSQEKLSEEWHKITGDSFVVGVTKCKNGFRDGLMEVVKYSCKFSSMTVEQTWHFHKCSKGNRLFQPLGCLRGVDEPDIDSDDISDMSGDFRDFIARYLRNEEKYSIEYVDDESNAKPLNFAPPSPRPVREKTDRIPSPLRKPMTRSEAYALVMLANRKPSEP